MSEARKEKPKDEEKITPIRPGVIKYRVEELAARMQVSQPVFAGVMEYMGWAAGKQVVEEDFKGAVKSFLNAPAGKRRR